MCGGEQDNEVRPNLVKEMETLARICHAVNTHRKIVDIESTCLCQLYI